ncbi:hypothetical protein BCR34DRAFT_180847 [Clohesyomyces aquaticus]|uniref:Uncharacterized protein n=1 Tax=Clohesyomyces aquaticus TaxID=1231657 RepID=A0A1Y1YEK8_9PLEO|nr:hypothetical protein BCR34DRAFT_180847 [Clohesyomyces aquaticus]
MRGTYPGGQALVPFACDNIELPRWMTAPFSLLNNMKETMFGRKADDITIPSPMERSRRTVYRYHVIPTSELCWLSQYDVRTPLDIPLVASTCTSVSASCHSFSLVCCDYCCSHYCCANLAYLLTFSSLLQLLHFSNLGSIIFSSLLLRNAFDDWGTRRRWLIRYSAPSG